MIVVGDSVVQRGPMMLTLRQVAELLSAEVLSGDGLLDREVPWAFGGDLMSDVLALAKSGTLLLTGLTNPQVIRTAEMIEASGIVLVRGKRPTVGDRTLQLASESGIPVLSTPLLLYDSCGRLYAQGLRGCIGVR